MLVQRTWEADAGSGTEAGTVEGRVTKRISGEGPKAVFKAEFADGDSRQLSWFEVLHLMTPLPAE